MANTDVVKTGNEVAQNKPLTVSQTFGQKSVQERFEKLLGKKTQGFITSVLQVTSAKGLKNANPQTVLTAAATAAALDLPINQNLGYAWIVPYKGDAQFQLGAKGYVQLALRTREYSKINVTEVYENQFKSWNAMTEELGADFSVEGEGKIAGYVAYFKLRTGFEKTVYWSRSKVERHGKKYSKSFNNGPWKDMFDDMAKKTVLKQALSKWGILSIELQNAIEADQSVQEKEGQYQYPDNNQTIDLDELNRKEEEARISKFIDKAESIDDLKDIQNTIDIPESLRQKFNQKWEFFNQEVES